MKLRFLALFFVMLSVLVLFLVWNYYLVPAIMITPAARVGNGQTPGLSSTPEPVRAETKKTVTVIAASSTPTPTLHPLSIERMRQGQYPGSDIVIEEKLKDGANYSRYLTSYRSEGLKIYALLTVPFGKRPPTGWPVIIFNHGYIEPDKYRTTERYVAYVDAFARKGYIVLRSDYRGHGNSEGRASGAYGSPDYTVDVLNAVASIKRYPDADAQRIGMWGHSMGGHITLRAMLTTKDIKAGVIWAGVVASYPDMFTRWHPTTTPGESRRWGTSWYQAYGTPEENPQFWNSISPIDHVAELSGPIQLHHGTADKVVPLLFSELLYEQALKAGILVEFYQYPGDDHNIAKSFATAMPRSVEFFDRYVKGE